VPQGNPYSQEQMPMGFGAERANLMGEAAIHMPSTAGNALNHGNEEQEEENPNLNAKTNNAKTNLIQEILAFNTESQQVEHSNEDNKDDSEQMAYIFTAKDPIKVGKVTKYTVTGRDSMGEWNCQRRYNEFETLHRVLLERWPGCYIPAIPEKVAVTIDVQNMKM